MNKEQKNQEIQDLAAQLNDSNVVYLTDTSGITVETANNLRRNCFKSGVSMKIVKNTLLRKAMEQVEGKDFSEMYDLLKGQTVLMMAEAGNAPAKVIKDFRKKSDKPVVKGAFIDEAIYLGDEQLDALASLKSKEELIGDVILLLQSPIKNVVSSLQSGGSTLSGLVKALEERAQ